MYSFIFIYKHLDFTLVVCLHLLLYVFFILKFSLKRTLAALSAESICFHFIYFFYLVVFHLNIFIRIKLYENKVEKYKRVF